MAELETDRWRTERTRNSCRNPSPLEMTRVTTAQKER